MVRAASFEMLVLMAALTIPISSSLLNLALLFVDGLLFGLAAKKALTSLILLVVAIVLATYLGLSIPLVSPASIGSHLVSFLTSLYAAAGPIIFSFPIVFIAGFAIGIWKG